MGEADGRGISSAAPAMSAAAALVRSALLVALAAAPLAAQQPAPEGRRYLPDRADEDWSFLATAPDTDFWDPLKYIALGRDGWYATLSAEVRYRAEGLRIRPSETRPSLVDNYFLQRYLFGADLHFGPSLRVFTEVQSGVINGSIRTPRATDLNRLDLHQAFVEWRRPMSGGRGVTMKAGRQELAVGSTRLISASPGLNVKRSFDGVSLAYRASTWTFVAAGARLVPLDPGVFDDELGRGQPFWGVAAGRRKSPRFDRGELGVYYLGIDRADAPFAQGIARERRHTAGAKWNGSGKRAELNWDAIYQWGEFGASPIRAWAVATETAYRWAGTRWRPRVSLRADMASGDADRHDDRLESFNPLFPGNSYSGAVGLLGPTNITDFTPALTVMPRRDLVLMFEAPSYWRTSGGDGVYNTSLRLLLPPTAGAGKYVGTNPSVVAIWQATPHLQTQFVITRFLAGGFTRDTLIGPGFGFYSATFLYRF